MHTIYQSTIYHYIPVHYIPLYTSPLYTTIYQSTIYHCIPRLKWLTFLQYRIIFFLSYFSATPCTVVSVFLPFRCWIRMWTTSSPLFPDARSLEESPKGSALRHTKQNVSLPLSGHAIWHSQNACALSGPLRQCTATSWSQARNSQVDRQNLFSTLHLQTTPSLPFPPMLNIQMGRRI